MGTRPSPRPRPSFPSQSHNFSSSSSSSQIRLSLACACHVSPHTFSSSHAGSPPLEPWLVHVKPPLTIHLLSRLHRAIEPFAFVEYLPTSSYLLVAPCAVAQRLAGTELEVHTAQAPSLHPAPVFLSPVTSVCVFASVCMYSPLGFAVVAFLMNALIDPWCLASQARTESC